MKLFSRTAFICNISFVVFVILQYIEFNSKKNKGSENILPLPFVTGTLVILGQLAIFINLASCMVALGLLAAKKINPAPRWLVITNFIMLLVQVYYFFIY